MRSSIKSSKSQKSVKQGSNPALPKLPSYKAEGSAKSKRSSVVLEARRPVSIEEVKTDNVDA
jgi:hypothetical protein